MSEKFTKEELAAATAQFTRPCNFVISVANLVQLPESDLDEVAFAGRSNEVNQAL